MQLVGLLFAKRWFPSFNFSRGVCFSARTGGFEEGAVMENKRVCEQAKNIERKNKDLNLSISLGKIEKVKME